MHRFVALVALVALLTFVAAACGDDDDAAAPAATTTTPAEPVRDLEVLVTNDDGYDAPGIDAVVEALRKEPGIHVTVVAPATNQSGAGDKTTPGDLAVTDVTTKSGYAGKAVAGHPADAVDVALDKLGFKPDVVVSGTNAGQNVGPFSTISGTVGAAKAAVRRGIPAFAASTGLADELDFAGSAALVLDWVRSHRDALLAGTAKVEVESLNVPTCAPGTSRRGVVTAPLAGDFAGRDASAVHCDSTKPLSAIVDDVDAFLNGFAVLTPVPAG
jgi:5'-nucleotidase